MLFMPAHLPVVSSGEVGNNGSIFSDISYCFGASWPLLKSTGDKDWKRGGGGGSSYSSRGLLMYEANT